MINAIEKIEIHSGTSVVAIKIESSKEKAKARLAKKLLVIDLIFFK